MQNLLSTNFKKQIPWILSFLIIALLYFALFWQLRPIANAEPDQYFHLAIAKKIASEGWVHSLPQVDNLSLKENYPNYYLLFSLVSGLVYKMGGEQLTLALVPFLGILFFFLLLLISKKYISAPIACLVMIAMMLTPEFITRLILFRPHLLAMIFIVLICWGVLRRNTLLTLVSCFLYALSYHAIYIPAIVLGIGAIVGYKLGKSWLKPIGAGLIGLVLGSVINPAFPQNLNAIIGAFDLLATQHAEVVGLPMEMKEISLYQWLIWYLYYGIFIIIGLIKVFPPCRRFVFPTDETQKTSQEFLFILVTSILFWLLVKTSTRAIEYAVPISFFLILLSISEIKNQKRTVFILSLLIMLLLVPRAYSFIINPQRYVPPLEGLLEAIPSIPKDNKSAKVFNCEWSTGSVLLYKRPDLKFVDLADPRGLARESVPLFSLRNQLLKGEIVYPFGVIRYAFDSDYVVCANPYIANLLERDPYFKRIYPQGATKAKVRQYFVFEMAENKASPQIMNFERTLLPPQREETPLTQKQLAERNWKDLTTGTSLPAEQRSPYFDLFGFFKNLDLKSKDEKISSATLCVGIRPKKEVLQKYQGALYIGLGGGPGFRLWLNRIPFYKGWSATKHPQLLTHLVPLPRKLKVSDEIVMLVCAPANAKYMGFAMSLWSETELDEACEWKTGVPRSDKLRVKWKYVGSQERSCVGKLAVAVGSHR